MLHTILASGPEFMPSEMGCYTAEDSNWLTCALDQMIAAMGGETTFALIIGAVLILAYFKAGQGDLATPATLLVLTGAIMMPLLPGQFARMGNVIIVLGLTAAILAVARRYILSGVQ